MVLSLCTCSSVSCSFDFSSAAKLSCAKKASRTGKVIGCVPGAALVFAGVGAGVVAVALVAFVLAAGAGWLAVGLDESVTQPTPARSITTVRSTGIDRRLSRIALPFLYASRLASG